MFNLYISSDINSVLPHTKDIIFLKDHCFGHIDKQNIVVKEHDGNLVNSEIKHINWSPEHSDKNGYDHYMLKEIHEQPDVIRRILSKYITELQDIYFKNISKKFRYSKSLLVSACFLTNKLYKKCLELAAHKSSKLYLAIVSFVESSFFPVPPDVMIIPMVISKKNDYKKIFLITTIFSVLGGMLGYFIGAFFF